MSKQVLPSEFFLPMPPEAPDWAKALVESLSYILRVIALRADLVVLEGTTSERPDPDGSKRFYYDTTTDTLYYDKGSWVAV